MQDIPQTLELLTYSEDRQIQEWKETSFVELSDKPALILLGPPGAGKTHYLKKLETEGEGSFCTASRFIRGKCSRVSNGQRLLIDGFDECRSQKSEARKGTIEELADELEKHMPSQFLITCREADWQHFIDSTYLRDELNLSERISVVRLKPFERKQILEFMAAYGLTNPVAALREAEELDLDAMLCNPQTLFMLCGVYTSNGRWPERKQALYEQACLSMAEEVGEKRRELESPRSILEKAGALFACMLLTGHDSIVLESRLAEEGLYAKEVDEHWDWRSVLDSRLFMGVDGNAYAPVHRTVAEYLGAKYLVAICESGFPSTRIVGLIRNAYGVPRALRGLAGWLCTLSKVLAEQIVNIDPLAIFHSGDIAALSPDVKVLYFNTLVDSSMAEAGVSFEGISWELWRRFEDLWTPNLEDALTDVLSTSDYDYDVYKLVSCVVAGGKEKARTLFPSLLDFIRKSNASIIVRAHFVEVLLIVQPGCYDDLLELLRDIDNGVIADTENELRGELLAELYPETISPCDIGGYLVTPSERLIGSYKLFLRRLVEKTPKQHRPCLMSSIVESDVNLGGEYRSSAREQVYKIFLAALESNEQRVTAEIIWRWLDALTGWYFDFSREKDSESVTRFMQWSEKHPDVSDGLWCELFKDGGKLGWGRFQLFSQGVIAKPSRSLLSEFERILTLLSDKKSLAPELNNFVLTLGKALAGQRLSTHEELCMINISKLSPAFRKSWEFARRCDLKYRQQDRKRQKKTHRRYFKVLAKGYRNGLVSHLELLHERRALPLLSRIAKGYLYGDTNLKGTTPEERLQEICGEKFKERVESAFLSLLLREDLPSVQAVADSLTKEQVPLEVHPMLVAVRIANLRRDSEIQPTESAIKFATCSWAIDGHWEDNAGLLFLIKKNQTAVTKTLVQFWGETLKTCPSSVRNINDLSSAEELVEIAGEVALNVWLGSEQISWGIEKYLIKTLIKQGLIHQALPQISTRISSSIGPISTPRDLSYIVILFLGGIKEYEEFFIQYFSQEYAVAVLLEYDGVFEEPPELSYEQVFTILRVLLIHAEERERAGTYRASVGETAWRRAQGYMQSLAQDSSVEAGNILWELYKDEQFAAWRYAIRYYIRGHIAQRREAVATFPTPVEIYSALQGGAPATHADFLALVEDSLLKVAKEIRSGKNGGYEIFWTSENDPRRRTPKKNRSTELVPLDEESARDRLCSLLAPYLEPFGIHREPHNRDSKRTDILVSNGSMEIPVEAKGQWNTGSSNSCGVWDGIEEQLIPLYTRSPQARGYGIFLVFWFGTEIKPLPAPPEHYAFSTPQTPEELNDALIKTIPSGYEKTVKVVVVDCSRSD